jgi:hypothetical protein
MSAPTPRKKSKSIDAIYPVKKVIEGVPVRKKNILSVYIDERRWITIIELVNLSGLSAAKILGISSKPCDCCKNKPIHVVLDNGATVEIPRGLMYYKKESRGDKKKNLINNKRK